MRRSRLGLPFSENPILLREARARSRSPVTPAALTAYLAAVAAVACTLFSLAAVGSPGQHPGAGQLERVAYHSISFQIVLAALFAPALGAGVLSGERQEGTFDLLLLGTLKARSIVVGKWLATVAYLLLFVVAALPLYLAVFLHAGLGLGQLAVAELLTVTTAAGGVALGLFLSALCSRTATATLAGCALSIALCLDVVLAGLVPAPGTGLPQTASQLIASASGRDTTDIPTDATGTPLPLRRETVNGVRLANPLYAVHKSISDPHPAVDPHGVPIARVARSLVPGDKSWSTWGLRLRHWQLSALAALGSAGLLLAGATGLVAGPGRRRRHRAKASSPLPTEPGNPDSSSDEAAIRA